MRARLIAAFEESLDSAPEAADVLAGIRTGILRRRRLRSAVAALVMVLLTGLALAWSNDRPRQDDTVPVGSWPTTFSVGWVPDGLTLASVTSTSVQETRTYTAGPVTLTIQVQRFPFRDLPQWAGPQINGRPSLVSPAGSGWIIRFQLPSGRLAEVDSHAENSTALNETLRVVAERVAASVRDNGGAAVRVGFAPTYLPSGQRIIGVTVDQPESSGAGAIVCVSGSLAPLDSPSDFFNVVRDDPAVDLGVGLTIGFTLNRKLTRYDERIADSQGRPAYLSRDGVVIGDFHGGWLEVSQSLDGAPRPLVPASETGRLLSSAELIKVAEGVRWVG